MLTLVVPELSTRARSAIPDRPSLEDEVDKHDSDDAPVTWSVDAIVQLHMVLLEQLAVLADPAKPLEEKLELLQWVFTERELEDQPFSFSNCVKLCGRSYNPHYGLMSADDVRHELARFIPRWMKESLALYPEWIQQAVSTNPEWVWARLEGNPQFINRAARRSLGQGDLFCVPS